MSWLGRIFSGDEELGKKNDDHRSLNSTSKSSWAARKAAPNAQKRRIFYGICALLFIYVFINNIPTDLGPSSRHNPNSYLSPGEKLSTEHLDPPLKKPKRPATPSEAEEHYHDGPIKFYMLAASLHAAAQYGGQHDSNKNVIFAASSLKSASEIIPLACEMARWERNDVHFAIMGRDEMDMREIKKINGAEEDCNVHWHDARPDYSRWSTDFRMEVSISASLEHIQTFIHPQVLITDCPSAEDSFFVSAIRSKALDIGRPLIELPPDAAEKLMWLTRLDKDALAAWTTTYVDIFIQALPESSGSLVRLLKSIENADYFGNRRPHLTIELPTEIDPPTWTYLQNFIWPPLDWSGAPHVSQVSLRHRIPRRTSTEYEASGRLVESFYPLREQDSHVLLLSPQVELSPLYYHYVMYNLLEYRYSGFSKADQDFPNLIGFSLELPTHFLNDTEPLKPQILESLSHKGVKTEEPTPFLWQAPNSNAALYFGEKWMEFHSFLSARLSKPPTPPTARRKNISDKHPSWLEFLLELMRVRGYSLLYPHLPPGDATLVTVHDELYQIPEEYPKEPSQSNTGTPELNPNEPLAGDYEKGRRQAPPNAEHTLLESTLISLLPNNGDLPELSNLPLLSFNGITMTRKLSHEAATTFSEEYRSEIGECRSSFGENERIPNSAVDLFCNLDVIYDPFKPPLRPYSNLGEIPPTDEDAIAAADHSTAKEEASAHLARQQQGHVEKGKVPAPVIPNRYQPQQDDSPETQNEFKLQMERQAKQIGSDHDSATTKPDPGSETDATGDAPLAEEKNDANQQPPVAQGDGSQFSNPTSQPPQPEGPQEQDANGAVEDPQAQTAQEKGPGW